jgi:thiamine kinase-like enzyme
MHEEVTESELIEVVARLAALLGPREGGVQPLSGGITNRNYRVNFGATDYVVRLPGKRTDVLGIDREAERVATKAAAELGIAPRVAAMLEEPSCLVTSFIDGREMTKEELRRGETLVEVARDLRSFHDSGTELPAMFDSFRLVERYAEIASEHGAELPAGYEEALERSRAVASAIAGHADHAAAPCHNDLLSANFLYDGERVEIIDWEYAGMGDRFFDLGNFAVNNELDDDQGERLLEAYFGEPPGTRRRAALELFRFMSDFREGMWGVVQTALSELDFDFEGYARKHFQRLAQTGSDPRFDAWVGEAAR